MSVDTYFCFCCLSTSDLTNIYGFHSDTNFAKLLKEFFMIEPFQDDLEDDYYICDRCAGVLKHIDKFKIQILETLNVLQTNGLIAIEKDSGGHISVKKVMNEEDEQKLYLDKLKEESIIEIVIERERNLDTSCHTQIEKEIKTETSLDVKTQDFPQTEKNELSININQSSDSGIDRLKCRHCAVVLPNVYMLHKHLNIHFPNHICDTCGKGFLTEKKLRRHMSCHNEGPFTCSKCNQLFKNYNTLISHKRRKHDLKPTKRCDSCQKIHCSCRKTEPLYKCFQCDKSFYSASTLYSHRLNSHNRTKRHFCQHCTDGFFFKQDLIAHEATHTGKKAFKCTLCSKSYPRRKSLTVHMRTHTNDRRFACDICGKRFIQKCTLVAHFKVHNQKTAS